MQGYTIITISIATPVALDRRCNAWNGTLHGQGDPCMLMLLLVCASLASLAFGVLVAYAVCNGMLLVFRRHAQSHAAKALAVSANVAHSS
ncbi:MAG: hypothetical protein ACP5EP_06500 [Acidobacteriaceae bacterium]